MIDRDGSKKGESAKLINEQALLGILSWMPPEFWKQWAKERPNSVQEI
jgi:hypothetical protein